jgi:antimicrobial peptide system SdpA family protein
MGVVVVAPEGWGFFTRNPRLPNPYVYRRQGEGWVRVGEAGNRFASLLGLKRDSRAQGIELERLLARLPAGAWKACEGGLEACLAGEPPFTIPVPNPMRVRSLCGELAVEAKEPVPWAWSRSAGSIRMPSKVALLKVSC